MGRARKVYRDKDQSCQNFDNTCLLSYSYFTKLVYPTTNPASIHQLSLPPMTPFSFRYALLSLILLPFTSALKFDVAAHTGRERCIRNFVAKDTLVLVTAIVDGQKGDGQQVNMHVSLSLSSRRCQSRCEEHTHNHTHASC